MHRIQGDHVQEPVPREHVRPVPALGVLARLRDGRRDPGATRTDRRRTGARPRVRRLRRKLPETVPGRVHDGRRQVLVAQTDARAAAPTDRLWGVQSVVPLCFTIDGCVYCTRAYVWSRDGPPLNPLKYCPCRVHDGRRQVLVAPTDARAAAPTDRL